MKKVKKILLLLCVFSLCVSLAAVPAFADQTVIIAGSYEEPDSVAPVVEDPFAGTPIQQETMPDVQIAAEPQSYPILMQADTAVQVMDPAPTTLAEEVVRLTNERRAAYGLSALSYSSALQEAANIRARESAQQFSHTRPDGSSCHSVVPQDYHVAGENLILVTTEFCTAELLVETWMNSETHRANILLADFTQIAVGVYRTEDTTYVSQIFLG